LRSSFINIVLKINI